MIEITNFMEQINLWKLVFLPTFALGNKCNFYERDTFLMSKGENKIKGQNRVVKLGLTFYFAFIPFYTYFQTCKI